MKDHSSIEELDSCDHLYLEAVSEPNTNGIRLVLSEGIVADREVTWMIGDVNIPNVRPIEVTGASRWFEVFWGNYIAYAVRNECYSSWDKGEESSGNSFRIYTKSAFLDFVLNGTFARDDYPGPFAHYQIVCSDHIIDVASEHPPEICRVRASHSSGPTPFHGTA